MNDEAQPSAFPVDILSFSLAVLGNLICLGAVTLAHTRTITLLIGLAVIMVAREGMLPFIVHIREPEPATVASWSLVVGLLGIVSMISVARVLTVLL